MPTLTQTFTNPQVGPMQRVSSDHRNKLLNHPCGFVWLAHVNQ